MTPRTILAVLALPLLLASANVPHPGKEPYTPTKQEWLLVEMGPCSRGPRGNSVATISAGDDSETIEVDLYYNDRAMPAEVELLYDATQNGIKVKAMKHNWRWIKVTRKDHPHTEIYQEFTCPLSF